MKKIEEKQDFFTKLLIAWLGVFSVLLPLCFCFYTYDSAQIKITLFYIAACGAFFIWLSGLFFRRQNPFTKKNFYTFLPLIIYFLYIAFSYFFKPYRLARLDSFARIIFSGALFCVVAFELDKQAFKTLLKYFFISAWAVFVYGILQFLNLDFLPWKAFFDKRIFSTLANPNLLGSFAVFTAVLAFFSFLNKPRKNLIFLFVLAIINLIFTESKGAWLAFGISLFLGAFGCLYFFSDIYEKHKKKIFLLGLIPCVLAVCFTFNFSFKRSQSVSFRLSTWRASWDMVEASPVTGTGIGSFEIIYPAYKRPEIFYMEKLHNMQSQHAENYYLEQLATLGLIGFGLFLWVLFYVFKQILFKLKIFVKEDREKAFLLAGFALASFSVYIHNFVDVSIYFASTSFFLILFNGIIFNLAFGPFETLSLPQKQQSSAVFKAAAFLILLFICAVFIYIQIVFWKDFFIPSQLSFLALLYVLFFLAISCALLFLLIKILFKVRQIKEALLVLFTAGFFLLFWFQFMSNVYFSRATVLAENSRFEGLIYYTKALKYNPALPMLNYFRGLMFLNRFHLAKTRDKAIGDGKELSDDFERALRDFTRVKNLAPNTALLNYNLGSLYLKYAPTREQEQREYFYFKAQENLEYALLLDPVDENIYFQLANIELARGNVKEAIYYVKEYLKGPSQLTNAEYLKTHSENAKAKQVLKQLEASL